MITISLCMIVKNEQDTLGRALDSVKELVDEIVIADTGSTDQTKEIARRYTDKIYDFIWNDDFSAARNFSFAQATKDYILWMDADDILLPQDAVKFKKLKEKLPASIDVVMMKYNTGFDEHGQVTFSCYRERLVKRSRGFRWQEPVHEYLAATGPSLTAGLCLTHAKPPARSEKKSRRNLRIYENQLSGGARLSPRGMYYYARELKEHGRYGDAIDWFRRFLRGGHGWTEDKITACGELAQCYQKENQPAKALDALLESFRYDTPRAEICCRLGYHYKKLGQYKQAAFWFRLALSLEPNEASWGFRCEDCRGYIPCIELAVCYDKLGDVSKAAAFNEQAAHYKPDSSAVAFNRRYFRELAEAKS